MCYVSREIRMCMLMLDGGGDVWTLGYMVTG